MLHVYSNIFERIFIDFFGLSLDYKKIWKKYSLNEWMNDMKYETYEGNIVRIESGFWNFTHFLLTIYFHINKVSNLVNYFSKL